MLLYYLTVSLIKTLSQTEANWAYLIGQIGHIIIYEIVYFCSFLIYIVTIVIFFGECYRNPKFCQN